IPINQTDYRPGRSTTENVFTMKVLIEKALTESNYEINVLLLDMSKAFDSVERKILLDDLRNLVGPDELHILRILIEEVVIQIRNNKTVGEAFKAYIGIPQRDCLSPVLFTLYLAKALKIEKESEESNEDHSE